MWQAGWRYVEVTAQGTKLDLIHEMRLRADGRYPGSVRVVADSLNTHGPGSLCEAFEPAEERGLVKKLEFHHMLKHGGWLNTVGVEPSSRSGSA